MNRAEQSRRPAGRAPWVLARWLLLATVIAAVFVLHVLTADEDHAGHPDQLGSSVTAASWSATDRAVATGGADGTYLVSVTGPVVAVGHPADGDRGDGTLAVCLLFLTAAAPAALALLLALMRRRHIGFIGIGAGGNRGLARRGPPLLMSPRLAAAVIRV